MEISVAHAFSHPSQFSIPSTDICIDIAVLGTNRCGEDAVEPKNAVFLRIWLPGGLSKSPSNIF